MFTPSRFASPPWNWTTNYSSVFFCCFEVFFTFLYKEECTDNNNKREKLLFFLFNSQDRDRGCKRVCFVYKRLFITPRTVFFLLFIKENQFKKNLRKICKRFIYNTHMLINNNILAKIHQFLRSKIDFRLLLIIFFCENPFFFCAKKKKLFTTKYFTLTCNQH